VEEAQGLAEANAATAASASLKVGFAVAPGGVLAIVLGLLVTRLIKQQVGGEPRDAARLARRVADGDISMDVKMGVSISSTEDAVGLRDVITEGEFYGMQTFDQSLYAHVVAGRVRVEEALKHASSPHDFSLMLAAGTPHRGDTFYASEPNPSTLDGDALLPGGRNGQDRLGISFLF